MGERKSGVLSDSTQRMQLLGNNALPSGVHANRLAEEEQRHFTLSTEYVLVCMQY